MILFRNVSLSLGKSTTRFGVSPFFRRKVTIFIGRETKTHIFSDENRRKKIGQVSLFINNYSFRIQKPLNNNNNNTIWGGSVLTGEEPPPHAGELKHALFQAGGPTQSQLSRPVSSRRHISMEHRLRRKQLNSDTNASKKKYLKEIQEQRKEETFFLQKKMNKENEKHLKIKK